MTGRSSARLLAPLALAAAVVALFAVLASGGGGASDSSGSASPAATATATAAPKNAAKRRTRAKPTTYTVQAGDTPSSIADQQDVDLGALVEANPDIDPAGLTPGQELKLP